MTALIAATASTTPALCDNVGDLESRNSGYETTVVDEFPELEEVWAPYGEPDALSPFEVKKARFEQTEAEWIEADTDSIFVSCRETRPSGKRIIITHVLVADPTTQVKVGESNDAFGGERERTSDFAKRTGATVATNGSYFYYETGQPIDACAPVVLLDGKAVRPGKSNGSEICLRLDGSFFSPHPSIGFTNEDLANLGVISILGTADPLLISDGVPQTFPSGVSGAVYPRTAIGVVCPGEYYLITAGNDGSYDGGLSYVQMRTIFWKLGCVYARSLDGGGSVSLAVNGELRNVPAGGSERPVVDFLAFYDAANVPTNEATVDPNGFSTEADESDRAKFLAQVATESSSESEGGIEGRIANLSKTAGN